MNGICDSIEESLFELADVQYKEFHQKLMSTVPNEKVIGVRTPVLRRFAREVSKSGHAEEFMSVLPHKYYDEDNLHAFLIEQIKDYDECISALDKFLPYVDNWATCDLMSPHALSSNLSDLLLCIDCWLCSKHTYEVRFGIVSLMRYYLKSESDASILYKVASISSGNYFIDMARSWFFATSFCYHWEETLKILKEYPLDKFTHNKTIQKAIESRRLSSHKKKILANMKQR